MPDVNGTQPLFPAEEATKRCCRCKEIKQFSEFNRNKRQSDGLQNYCRPCHLAWRKEHYRVQKLTGKSLYLYRRRRDKDRSNRLLRTHGIDGEAYESLLAAQDGVCAICGFPETMKRGEHLHRLVVDHDHETGKFRGLLCRRCNMGIGYLKDDPRRLQSAIEYLKKHGKSDRP